MAAALHEHRDPDRFIAGTVGLPGERTFYLQAKSGRRLTSVVVEKEQVAILAERIAELLDLVRAKAEGAGDVPEEAPPQLLDNGELATPIDPEFRVGTMSLSWDGTQRRVVVECFAMGEGEADEDGESDALRVVVDAGRAREFVRRAEQVIDAGRGDCPLCSLPLGSTGHLCPRANGVPPMTGGIDEHHLATGTVTVLGVIPDSSNAALLCAVTSEAGSSQAVFKPTAGERPLADFPVGTLAHREIAAYRLSRAAGFDCVPPTVVREVDGLGPGSLQAWVEQRDPDDVAAALLPVGEMPDGWHAVLRAEDEEGRELLLAHADEPGLRRLALFDLVVGNADRKGGHVLRGHWDPGPEADIGLLGIDHGLCFHAEDKLRTVFWGWSGTSLASEEIVLLEAVLAAEPEAELAELLADEEIAAMRTRTSSLLSEGRWPVPPRERMPLPWPPL